MVNEGVLLDWIIEMLAECMDMHKGTYADCLVVSLMTAELV